MKRGPPEEVYNTYKKCWMVQIHLKKGGADISYYTINLLYN